MNKKTITPTDVTKPDSNNYLFTILTDAFIPWHELNEELLKRGVRAFYCESSSRRIYAIDLNDLHLMPEDDKGHYIGTDEQGFSLYQMYDIDEYRTNNNYGNWHEIK